MSGDFKKWHDYAGTKIAKALRAHFGAGTAVSISDLSKVTGLNERTIRSHISGDAQPNSTALLLYMKHLPFHVCKEILLLADISVEVARKDSQVTPHAVLQQLGKFIALFSEVLEDNIIDHREALIIEREANILISKLNSIIEKSKRQTL